MVASERVETPRPSPATSISRAVAPTSSRINENTPTGTLIIEVLKQSLPLGLAAVAQMSISVVMVAMVGRMVGDTELGATTLAAGLLNAFAFSFAAGFCGALETVLSHSYGRDPTSKLYGVYGLRMSMMLLIIAACVGPLLAFSDSLLIAIGQNATVAHFTGRFCRTALFGVYSVMLLELMRRYFACQHLNTQLSVNLVASAISFPFVLWVCITFFGFAGAAIGWVILMGCMPASLLIYLYVTGKYKKTWGGWDPTALTNWRPLLRLAFPSMAMMMSEWMSLEINLIIAGFALETDLAAFSIVYQCSSIFWSLVSGVFIEAAVLVGNALGQEKPQFARRCAILCLGLSVALSIIDVIVMALFRHWIPSLFSSTTAVHDTFRQLLPFFCCYHIFDCVQSCMMGVLRGCGLQSLGAIAIALVYSVVGVPLGAIVFFKTGMGIRALWMGPAVGVTVVGFPLYMYLFRFYIHWDKLERRGEEVPDLNTSMDERSMRAFTGTPPPSLLPSDHSDDEEGERGRQRRGHSHHGTPRTDAQASPNTTSPENGSFTSVNIFFIPQRSILATGPYFSANMAASDGQSAAAAAVLVDVEAEESAEAEAATPVPREERGKSGVRGDASSSSNIASAPPCAQLERSSPPRQRSSSRSSSASNASRDPLDGQRTNLPSSSSSSTRSANHLRT